MKTVGVTAAERIANFIFLTKIPKISMLNTPNLCLWITSLNHYDAPGGCRERIGYIVLNQLLKWQCQSFDDTLNKVPISKDMLWVFYENFKPKIAKLPKKSQTLLWQNHKSLLNWFLQTNYLLVMQLLNLYVSGSTQSQLCYTTMTRPHNLPCLQKRIQQKHINNRSTDLITTS